MDEYDPYVELRYTCRGISKNYSVHLVSVLSNLGAGEVWYFLCPHTGKRCRILYCVDGEFLHREAFRNVYYDSQVRGKKMRGYDKLIGPLFKIDKMKDEADKPYYKKYYRGVPTRKYRRVLAMQYRASQVTKHDVDTMIRRMVGG